jgi:hypothetical protein
MILHSCLIATLAVVVMGTLAVVVVMGTLVVVMVGTLAAVLMGTLAVVVMAEMSSSADHVGLHHSVAEDPENLMEAL